MATYGDPGFITVCTQPQLLGTVGSGNYSYHSGIACVKPASARETAIIAIFDRIAHWSGYDVARLTTWEVGEDGYLGTSPLDSWNYYDYAMSFDPPQTPYMMELSTSYQYLCTSGGDDTYGYVRGLWYYQNLSGGYYTCQLLAPRWRIDKSDGSILLVSQAILAQYFGSDKDNDWFAPKGYWIPYSLTESDIGEVATWRDSSAGHAYENVQLQAMWGSPQDTGMSSAYEDSNAHLGDGIHIISGIASGSKVMKTYKYAGGGAWSNIDTLSYAASNVNYTGFITKLPNPSGHDIIAIAQASGGQFFDAGWASIGLDSDGYFTSSDFLGTGSYHPQAITQAGSLVCEDPDNNRNVFALWHNPWFTANDAWQTGFINNDGTAGTGLIMEVDGWGSYYGTSRAQCPKVMCGYNRYTWHANLQQLDYNNSLGVSGGRWTQGGQKFLNWPGGLVKGFYVIIYKGGSGSLTGTIYLTVRDSNDNLLGIIATKDASTLTSSMTSFGGVTANIHAPEDDYIRILVEYSGGDYDNFVGLYCSSNAGDKWADGNLTGHHYTYPAGQWYEWDEGSGFISDLRFTNFTWIEYYGSGRSFFFVIVTEGSGGGGGKSSYLHSARIDGLTPIGEGAGLEVNKIFIANGLNKIVGAVNVNKVSA